MTGPIQVLVRYLAGQVGESRRVVHVVPIWDLNKIPEVLIAYCGEQFVPGVAEQLYVLTGAPCELCISRSQRPNEELRVPHRRPGEHLHPALRRAGELEKWNNTTGPLSPGDWSALLAALRRLR